jgi:hypothetical protein
MEKGIKAFDKGLKCRYFQFKEGGEYKIRGNPKLCERGFHYCENPLDVLDYYDLCDSEFAEVISLGETKTDGRKTVTNHIKINAKIDLTGFIKASIDYLFEKTKVATCKYIEAASGDYSQLAAAGGSSQLAAAGFSSKLAASGDYSQLAAAGGSSQLAASGGSSQLAASGFSSKLAASGDYSQLAAAGGSSKLAASGFSSQLAASGSSSKLAASGDYSQLAASGCSSQLAAAGDYSQLAAAGCSSQLAMTGNNSVGANVGRGGIIKGNKGCWITLAEYKDNIPVCVKSAKIDGKRIKENTWYKLVDGKFTEVKDE